MRFLTNLSLRRKQMLIIMLTSSVALLLACAAFIAYDTVTFRRELSEKITILADAIGNNCAAAIDFNDPKTAKETLGGLRADDSIVSASVYSRDGRVFAVYQRDTASSFVPPAVQPTSQEFTSDELHLFRAIKQGGVMTGTIFVASNLKNLSARRMSYVVIVGLVFLTSLLVALVLSSRLQRLVSNPILHLAEVARAVAQDKNYSLRAKKQSNDEIGQLVVGFNEMLAQIQQRDAALQSARGELEIRVTERTADLKKANEALQVENAERKRTEESLRQSEEKFRQLASNITDVFWMTSPDQKEVLYVSPGYELIWGRSAESLYANPHQWAEAILPEERGRVFAIFRALTRSEPSVSVEYRIARPDGTVRWVHDRGFQVHDAAGNLVRLTGIVTDITERKQMEAQLVQSQKMETVGKLAGGIAHEFNSILTAIIGQSELLLGDLPSGSPHCANAIAIRKAADLAAALTKQLLAYGRKQLLRQDTLDLNRVLTSMEGMLSHLMGSDVNVRIVPAAGLPAVKADAGQIEQVIMNVAINAREAMRRGGKLTLETSLVTFDEEYVSRFPEVKAGDYVMLAISDTGTGMSEEVKAHLFEPFFTTKGVGEGAGLGLAMCHGIIKQSGGHINVYSEPSRGTTFKIYLPRVEQRTDLSTAKPALPDLPRGTETILLVEDDPSLREMVSLLLQRLGYTVRVAANGLEALNLIQQPHNGHIDLLFTDIVMPQMDGKELSDRIRALHPQTKTLFTSAYTENAAIHQGVLREGVALLQKPFTPSALAQKLRAVLDGRS